MEKIGQGHPISQSPDFVKENIELLKSLFPTIVKEGKIVMEELEALLGEEVEKEEEYYNFTWAGKSMARREANKPSTATLRPDKSESKDWDTTGNIFIEGDNLEVLKLLQKSYANKIKMIYIDPPYNTGKDFVYKDNYADNLSNYLSITGQIDEEGKKLSTNSESDGRYHSNWLNMIYPRLKLARNLLREDGVIFISIDENEASNLEKVCNEIFGEENFIGLFPVVMNLKGNQDAYGFAETHEFFIVCTKDKDRCEMGRFPIDEEEILKTWQVDEYGLFKEADNLRATGVNAPREKRPNLFYPIFLDEEKLEFYVTEENTPKNSSHTKILPINPEGEELSWYWGKTTFTSNVKNLILKKTSNGWQFYRKQRPQIGDLPTKKPKSFFYKPDYSTSTATTKLKELLGAKVFEGPKPVPLIKDFLRIGTLEDSIVLDFFSGSGTTAHSVIELNAEDHGDRKFICVQLPEVIEEDSEGFKQGFKTISEISKERIRKAGELIKLEKPKDLFSESGRGFDIGFRVFKLDASNIKSWDANPENLKETLFSAGKNIKEDRSEEDVLFEILLKYGLDLTVPIEEKKVQGKSVYSVGYGTLFICLADAITTEVAEAIGSWKEELNPPTARVIFKDSGFTDVQKTNSIQILKRFGITEVNTI